MSEAAYSLLNSILLLWNYFYRWVLDYGGSESDWRFLIRSANPSASQRRAWVEVLQRAKCIRITWRKIVQQRSRTSNAHFYFLTAQCTHKVQSQWRLSNEKGPFSAMLSDERGCNPFRSVHVHSAHAQSSANQLIHIYNGCRTKAEQPYQQLFPPSQKRRPHRSLL